MPDDMDRIQEINEQHQLDALAEHFRHRPAGESLSICAVCEEPIPEARRKAVPGVAKCFRCQEEWEMMHRRVS